VEQDMTVPATATVEVGCSLVQLRWECGSALAHLSTCGYCLWLKADPSCQGVGYGWRNSPVGKIRMLLCGSVCFPLCVHMEALGPPMRSGRVASRAWE
jgi:hypothetical protein